MNCPKCQAPMEKVKFRDVEVDRCTGCKGLWFDRGEHEKLRRMRGAEAIDTGDPQQGAGHNEQASIDCPVGHGRMAPQVDPHQRHLWYEQCPTCGGVFFDAGEFTDYKHKDRLDFFRSLWATERE